MIRLDNTTLFVIDVQKGLFNGQRSVYKEEELIDNINLLIKFSRQNNFPIYFVQHESKKMLEKDTEGWQLHHDLKVDTTTDNFLSKTKGSVFTENDIADKLKAVGINNIIITGLVTHMCVKTNCLEAKKLGFNVILAKDGHSNYHAEPKKMIDKWNKKLKEEGIEVLTTEQILKL